SLAPFGRVSKVLRPSGTAGSASAVSRRRPADVAAPAGFPAGCGGCPRGAAPAGPLGLVGSGFAGPTSDNERRRRPHDRRADGPSGPKRATRPGTFWFPVEALLSRRGGGRPAGAGAWRRPAPR